MALARAEGGGLSGGVLVLRRPQWTVARPLPPGVGLAWSEQRIGFTGAVHGGPVHPMGAPLDLALHPGLFAA